MEGRVKLGFLMLQIEKIDGETQNASELFGIYGRKVYPLGLKEGPRQ